jgi:hypothetical protein
MAEARTQESFIPNNGMESSVDTLLHRGTPGYYSLCNAMAEAAKPFLRPNARVVDLNARGGDWLEPLLAESSFRCRFIALNATEAEKDQCMNRFRMEVHLGIMQEMKRDLCEGVPPVTADLTMCAMALTAKSVECQAKVLKGIHKHTQKGGAMILVEANTPNVNWEDELRQAGFSKVMIIWSTSRFSSWLAVK